MAKKNPCHPEPWPPCLCLSLAAPPSRPPPSVARAPNVPVALRTDCAAHSARAARRAPLHCSCLRPVTPDVERVSAHASPHTAMGAPRWRPAPRSALRGGRPQVEARGPSPLNIQCILPQKEPLLRFGAEHRHRAKKGTVFAQYLSIVENPRRQRPSESKFEVSPRSKCPRGLVRPATKRLRPARSRAPLLIAAASNRYSRRRARLSSRSPHTRHGRNAAPARSAQLEARRPRAARSAQLEARSAAAEYSVHFAAQNGSCDSGWSTAIAGRTYCVRTVSFDRRGPSSATSQRVEVGRAGSKIRRSGQRPVGDRAPGGSP